MNRSSGNPSPLSATGSGLPRLGLLLWIVALSLVAGTPGSGQERPPGSRDPTARPFPYTLGAKDAVILGTGAALVVLDRVIEGGTLPLSLAEISALSPEDVNAFDRTGARSWSPEWQSRTHRSRNALVGVTAAASLAPLVLEGRWRDGAAVAVVIVETGLLLQGITGSLKAAVGRRRPYLFTSALSPERRHALAGEAGAESFRSFPSGHTSAAFGFAVLLPTIWTDVHGPSAFSRALWAVALPAAAYTAYGRVRAGQHYPTDVIAGAALGAGIGYLVPALHRSSFGNRVRVVAGPGGVAARVALP